LENSQKKDKEQKNIGPVECFSVS